MVHPQLKPDTGTDTDDTAQGAPWLQYGEKRVWGGSSDFGVMDTLYQY